MGLTKPNEPLPKAETIFALNALMEWTADGMILFAELRARCDALKFLISQSDEDPISDANVGEIADLVVSWTEKANTLIAKPIL